MKTNNVKILFSGDENVAYRDPAPDFDGHEFHLYFTLVKKDDVDKNNYLYVARSDSKDLNSWSEPKIITPKDRSLNYSSPGNVIEVNGKRMLCIQTYCRENGEKYGNERCRLYTMDVTDVNNPGKPVLLKVKGDIEEEKMGRMIDPYIIRDEKNEKWVCFYKQNGISFSTSEDFINWSPVGNILAGENPCIIYKDGIYYMYHSPKHGVGLKKSYDLINWHDTGKIFFFGVKNEAWAKGRITAGAVLDVSDYFNCEKYAMFFHGSGPKDESEIFDNYASIAVVFGDSLNEWN